MPLLVNSVLSSSDIEDDQERSQFILEIFELDNQCVRTFVNKINNKARNTIRNNNLKLFNSIEDAKLLNDIISSKEFEKMIDNIYAWNLEIEQAQNLINKSSLFICKFHE